MPQLQNVMLCKLNKFSNTVDVMTEKVHLCSRTKIRPLRMCFECQIGIYEKYVLDVCTWSGNEEGCFIVG
jgi:hypothetical protein